MTLNKILAIEDDRDIRSLLNDMGSGTIQAPDSIEAIYDLIRTNEYNAILVDRDLKGFATDTKGDAIVAGIRAGTYGPLNQHKEIYSISGDYNGMMEGATGHIRKPDDLFTKLLPLIQRQKKYNQ